MRITKIDSSESDRLAIVIPAYKPEFLAEALESLTSQTCRDFTVYIGDDASPHDLAFIVEPYRERLEIVYKRFDENLGGLSLVQQWNRCVQMSSDLWVWLFSDDDVAEPTSVERFFQALEKTDGQYDLYRFCTMCIDEQGQIVRVNPPHPAIESSLEYAYHRLCLNRWSFAPEHIFSREVFEREGGFVEFPLAWCSDDASWIAFGERTGIYTISGPHVRWRISHVNISSGNRALARQKIEALFQFVDWLTARIDTVWIQTEPERSLLVRHRLRPWFLHQLAVAGPGGGRVLHLAERMNERWPVGLARTRIDIARVACRWMKQGLKQLILKSGNSRSD